MGQMKIDYDRAGIFWHGFSWRCLGRSWFDFGIIAIDWYLKGVYIYCWKWVFIFPRK